MTLAHRRLPPYRHGAGPVWWTHIQPDHTTAVWLTCPRGHLRRLSLLDIGRDGTVIPGVVCHGDDDLGCDFRDEVRLAGWIEWAAA